MQSEAHFTLISTDVLEYSLLEFLSLEDAYNLSKADPRLEQPFVKRCLAMDVEKALLEVMDNTPLFDCILDVHNCNRVYKPIPPLSSIFYQRLFESSNFVPMKRLSQYWTMEEFDNVLEGCKQSGIDLYSLLMNPEINIAEIIFEHLRQAYYGWCRDVTKHLDILALLVVESIPDVKEHGRMSWDLDLANKLIVLMETLQQREILYKPFVDALANQIFYTGYKDGFVGWTRVFYLLDNEEQRNILGRIAKIGVDAKDYYRQSIPRSIYLASMAQQSLGVYHLGSRLHFDS